MPVYPLSLGRAFRGGALTGLAAGAASLVAGLLTLAITGWRVEPVPVPAMFIAAFVLTLVGTPVYWWIARGGRRDSLWWIVCAVVVTLYSVVQLWNPQINGIPGAVALVTILHIAAGAVVAVLLPRLAGPAA